MDVLPYLSGWILAVALMFLLYQILAYLPYGKLSVENPPYAEYHMIHPGVAFAVPYFISIVLFAIGWFENDVWNVDKPPESTRGWVAFWVLIVYFGWRVVSQVIIYGIINKDQSSKGKKKTTIILTIAQSIYYPAVAMNFRRMCYHMQGSMQTKDVIFTILTLLSLVANAFVDISLNIWRQDDQIATIQDEYIGKYLDSEQIKSRFAVLGMCGIEPNYAFEILAWTFFAIFTLRWEALWWIVATLCILIPRMWWSSIWYSESTK